MHAIPADLRTPAFNLVSNAAMNTMFAESVLEGAVAGLALADAPHNPGLVYVRHPHSMSLLCAREGNPPDEDNLKLALGHPRSTAEWLQVFPASLSPDIIRICESMGLAVELHTRINFAFHADRFRSMERRALPRGCTLVPIDGRTYAAVPGAVVPSSFWDSAESMLVQGFGVIAMLNETPASVAFSACANETHVELGVETAPTFRREGLGLVACSAAIDMCLARRKTPVWACRLGNRGSQRLAEQLGFEPIAHLPYLRISDREGR